MKLSTAKFLDTLEVEKEWWTVLSRARTIINGKVNDRLGAYDTVHNISQTIYNDDIINELAELEWIDKKNAWDFLFGIQLHLLRLRIFSILDVKDAKKVWEVILEPEKQKLLKGNHTFFYHIWHCPVLLLCESIENGLFPKDDENRLASIFPRSCIEDDYQNWLTIDNSESETRETILELQEELSWCKYKDDIERIKRQVEILKQNAARYL